MVFTYRTNSAGLGVQPRRDNEAARSAFGRHDTKKLANHANADTEGFPLFALHQELLTVLSQYQVDTTISTAATVFTNLVSKVLPPVLVPSRRKAAAQKNRPPELKGNTAKLWPFLERALNDRKFIALNQSATGIQSGVPMGSMTSTIPDGHSKCSTYGHPNCSTLVAIT